MTMQVSLTDLTGPDAGEIRDLVVLGPSLGTAVHPLWARCAAAFGPGYRIVGWDLPGHGDSAPCQSAFTVADLAEAVLSATRVLLAELSGLNGLRKPSEKPRLLYAGVSLGGAVGLQLAVSPGQEVDKVVVLGSAAKIGEAAGWQDRADLVRRDGTAATLQGSASRWFAPDFIDKDNATSTSTSTALLRSLEEADRFSYARCCEALADFDVRADLGNLTVPVLAIAGSEDAVTPATCAREIAAGVPDGSSCLVQGVGHLAPAEAPVEVAGLLREFFDGGARR
jgi:3-oxoadipate enol-lactonase